MPDRDLLAKLQAENARLIALLESHRIEWRQPPASLPAALEPSRLSTGEKVALFRRLFRGRTDVYPTRWESKTTGKSGYAPACANEWRAGVCEKPRIKCSDCPNRSFIPLSDAVIYGHLAGEHTVGVYPLLEDDSCYFLAVDFDEAEWRDDARAFVQSCEALGVPSALEISRSGQGAHAWVFFAGRVAARDARRLGTAIISHTCARTRQLQLKSYDRLFPNQDTMPKGGFGNLIALPLQKGPRESGCSVFVDAELRPYPDQWAFLAAIRPIDAHDIEPTILRATGGAHPLDVTFIDEEDLVDALEAPEYVDHETGWANAEIPRSDAGQPDLLRKGAAAAATGQSTHPAGRLPESGVLQGPGHADVGLGQAAGHRLRRELPAAHRAAPWLS